jgi:hypothetical protein
VYPPPFFGIKKRPNFHVACTVYHTADISVKSFAYNS